MQTAVLLLCGLAMVLQLCLARDRCVWATGRLVCHRNAELHGNVELQLNDYDGGTFLDPTDQMGYEISNDDGTFEISGCGSDLFPWNNPDPFLEVFHFCTDDPNGAVIKTKIYRIFAPETLDFGVIELDEPLPTTTTTTTEQPEIVSLDDEEKKIGNGRSAKNRPQLLFRADSDEDVDESNQKVQYSVVSDTIDREKKDVEALL